VRELEIDIDQGLESAERLAHMLDAQGHDISPRASIAPSGRYRGGHARRLAARTETGLSRRSSRSTSD
jgi:hypothetical protein